MSKQLVAPKHQADLVESLMGVLCQAQIEHAEKPAGTKLARGLNAALAFFEAFVLPDKEAAAAAAAAAGDAFGARNLRRLSSAPRAARCATASSSSRVSASMSSERAPSGTYERPLEARVMP